jgi:hypothetical protein
VNPIAILRYAATAVLAGLAAAYEYYPHQPWIPISIAVVGTLGIHVVPSAFTPQPQVVTVVPHPAVLPDPGLKAP